MGVGIKENQKTRDICMCKILLLAKKLKVLEMYYLSIVFNIFLHYITSSVYVIHVERFPQLL